MLLYWRTVVANVGVAKAVRKQVTKNQFCLYDPGPLYAGNRPFLSKLSLLMKGYYFRPVIITMLPFCDKLNCIVNLFFCCCFSVGRIVNCCRRISKSGDLSAPLIFA